MGRTRKHTDPLRPLPQGLYLHKNGAYRAKRLGGGYQYFGKDYDTACRDYRAWRDEGQALPGADTVAAMLDWYLACIAPQRLKPRTLADYRRYVDRCLKPALGHVLKGKLTAADLAHYRDARAAVAPSQVMKEFAPLSQAYKFEIERGALRYNPVDDVIAPKRRPARTRYVTDAEYLAIYNAATTPKVIRIAMTLAWRTLQEPADLVKLGPRDITTRDGRRCLEVARGKTGVGSLIIIEGDLARLIAEHPVGVRHFIHGNRVNQPRYAGQAYTSHGLAGMFYKAAQAAGITNIGLKDIRAKGATDMDNAGIDRRTIQRLLNHSSLTTTEIYLKKHNPRPISMNTRRLIA